MMFFPFMDQSIRNSFRMVESVLVRVLQVMLLRVSHAPTPSFG
jgi:hypothetical protein